MQDVFDAVGHPSGGLPHRSEALGSEQLFFQAFDLSQIMEKGDCAKHLMFSTKYGPGEANRDFIPLVRNNPGFLPGDVALRGVGGENVIKSI